MEEERHGERGEVEEAGDTEEEGGAGPSGGDEEASNDGSSGGSEEASKEDAVVEAKHVLLDTWHKET